MATYPIKVLLDRNRQPFIPFATTSSIVENGTNRRLDKILGNLDDLQTNNKNSLVSAINEILTQHGSGGSSTGWQVVDVLPTENISATTIYLLPKEGATKPNIYEEWIWVNEDWENIGTTEIDLSGYATTTMIGDLNTLKTVDKDSIVDAVNELVDKQLVAGENITIDGNVINANTAEHIYEINPTYLSHISYIDKTIISELITKIYTDGTEDPILRVRPTGRNSMISDINYYDFKLSSKHYPFKKETGYYFLANPLFTIHGAPINSDHVSLVCSYIYINGSWTDDIFTCDGLNYNTVFNEDLSNIALLTKVLSKTNTTSYTPTNDYHPATKKYVDDAIAAAGGGSGSAFDPAKYLAIDNTTEYTPTDLYHPATKAYVDSQIASVPEPVDAYSKTEIDGKLSNYLSKTNTESYTPTSDYHPATKKFVESVVSSIDMSGYYNKTDVDSMIGNVTKNNITFWNVAWKASPYYILPSTGAYVNLVGYSADDKVTMYSHVSTNKYMTTTSGENYIAAFKFTEPVTLKNVVTIKTKTKLGSSDYTGHTLIYHNSDSSNMVIQPTYKDVEYGASDSDGFFDTIITSYYDIKDTNLNKLLELYRYVAVGENFDEGGSNIICKKIESSWEII